MSGGAILFATGLVLAAYFDVAQRRVPNWLNVSLLVLGLASSVETGALMEALMTTGLAFVVILPFFYFRVYRGGDAKLLIACGA